jgi:flagellar biogenesis protein FliO
VPGNASVLTLTPSQQWGLVLGVFVFVAILGGFVWLSKRVTGGSVFTGKRVKVIDRTMLTRDSMVVLVQIGPRILAVGAGKGAPSLICELSPSDFPEFLNGEDAVQKSSGFWSRFARNMKAGVTGNAASRPNQDASFEEMLRQISEKDPVSGAEAAGDAGYPHFRETPGQDERRPGGGRFRRSYQANIENMTKLREPDKLDRRSRFYDEPDDNSRRAAPPPPPPPKPPKPVMSEEERAERIDNVLDLIARRQSRADDRNDTGEAG